mmetsp:Transcript_63960/g.169298  ORF Transcript_63960/g.169298 Transcript_63960/m.169298 type:complete len:255 (-) Transcript_63960:499-1263(-)
MPRHMEQPASRQSKPACLKTTSRPSASACSLTLPDPGTIIAWTPSATFRPWMMVHTERRSSMRLFVQDPMNTLSTEMSSIRCPGFRPMYWSACCMPDRFVGFSTAAGSGTTPVMGTTSSGLVPQVTVGGISWASMRSSLSYAARASDLSDLQYATADSQSLPLGARGRPLRYSKVVSSGAMMPARAPASMVMLQMDIRASMDKASMVLPQNSMTLPVPPAVPIRPMMWRITSFEVTPSGKAPDTSTLMFLAFFC